jgi:hypothetical protein
MQSHSPKTLAIAKGSEQLRQKSVEEQLKQKELQDSQYV